MGLCVEKCRRILLIVYSLILTACLIYQFIPDILWESKSALNYIFPTIASLWGIIMIINTYWIIKLLIFFYKKHTDDKYIRKLCIGFISFHLNWLFFGVFEYQILSSTHDTIRNGSAVSLAIIQPMAIITAYFFCSLSSEIKLIIDKYNPEKDRQQIVFGLSYMLFIFKWYSLSAFLASIIGFFTWIFAEDAAQISMFALWLFSSIMMAVFTMKTTSENVPERPVQHIPIAADDVSHDIVSVNSMVIDYQTALISNGNNSSSSSSKAKIGKMYKFGKSKYENIDIGLTMG